LDFEVFVSREVFYEIVTDVWNELEETYDKMDGSVIFNLMHKINVLKQGDLSDSLAMDHLPDVKDAFDFVSSKKSHKGLHPRGVSTKHQPTAFVVNNNNFNIRVNNSNNNIKVPNPNLICKNCGLIDHIIERCYELTSYRVGFKKSPNLPKQSIMVKRFNGSA
ncbi:hypothetical protein Tco_0780213, partial [Tanacetum coccineum]